MTGNDSPAPAHTAPTCGAAGGRWAQQWQQVPAQWRRLVYYLDTAPADTVFQRNPRYRPTPDGHDFTPH
ncbi:hypothetical protein, partial [Streptomyces lonegramiae]